MKKLGLLALSIVLAAVFTGCGKPPDAQLQQAANDLQAAKEAGAPQYAPEAWNRATAAAERMKTELESQGRRFRLLRSYRQVRILAEQASRLAGQALAEANSKKTQLRGELTAMIDELDASLKSARSQLSRVPRSKGLDTASLRSSLNAAGRQLDQARSNLGSGAYDSGLAVAARAREAINGVFRAIERATGLPVSKKR
jgi:hypothetical protein